MIWLLLKGLPPSANNAYFNLPNGKGRTLTKVGRAYLTETKVTLAQEYPKAMLFFKPNVPYLIVFRFRLDTVENKGWAKGKSETRYKKIDVTNRIKLLEDALKDAAGIDDSQNITVILDKQQNVGFEETTEIFAWNLEEEASPFDDALKRI
jgi:Holliday junction resolvase RusA-like endonuclease